MLVISQGAKLFRGHAMSVLDDFKLSGKVAVVTGSGQGIGRGIVWGLAEAGCDVVINARRKEDLEITAKGIEERGRKALIYDADIRDNSEKLGDLAVDSFGSLDIWVNNVGGSDEKKTRTLIDTPDDTFRNQLELNLTTAFQGAKAAAKRMSSGGAIINISSGAGIMGFPLRSPYAASKWAVVGVTKTLAMELGKFRIRVNAICPGTIKGDRMIRVIRDKAKFLKVSKKLIEKNFVSMASMNCWIYEEDIGNICSFLISKEGERISGQAIPVDGNATRMD